jgi:uncharacterized membrane protein HdeD (DUF308 family)
MSTTFNGSKAEKRADDPKNLAITAVMSLVAGLFLFSFILVPMSIYFATRGVIASIREHSKKHLYMNIGTLVVGVPFLAFYVLPKLVGWIGGIH